MHAGDFEIDGVGYVERTEGEMVKEAEYWRKGWEESAARRRLGRLLREEADVEEMKEEEEVVEEEEEEKESADAGLEGEKALEVEVETVKEENTTKDEPAEITEENQVDEASPAKEISPPVTVDEAVLENEALPTIPQPIPPRETPPTPPTHRRKVTNIIVLGLGSLQSARREGRRATLTQLAALQTIVQHLGMSSC